MTTSQPAHKRVTLEDVALEAGISRGTVSRVINGDRYVSDAARVAVETAIAKTSYVPNAAARNLARRRTRGVAVIVYEPLVLFVEDSNVATVLVGINSQLSSTGYQMVLLIVNSISEAKGVAEYLSSGSADGVILITAPFEDEITRSITRLQLPAVFFNHPNSVENATFIEMDNRQAAMDVVTRLLVGRNRVGMISAALDTDSGQRRFRGYQDALGDRYDGSLVEPCAYYSYEGGADAMKQLLRREPKLDGIFAASDAVAAGAVAVLKESGRQVPGDVGVVGFDDSWWALHTIPSLSTVHQPSQEMGTRAATAIVRLIQGIEEDREIAMTSHVVWRDSA
ncbi:LacI family DNA-binding transcriptional regulator [Glaciihabitans sp. UYNi722]|uniref:LacI family DNA-binding transcriptional regulator n=1 Tax=Glaciihabitans sp. UYNi722 TaxID=3156344 RepID=UPI0033986AF5